MSLIIHKLVVAACVERTGMFVFVQGAQASKRGVPHAHNHCPVRVELRCLHAQEFFIYFFYFFSIVGLRQLLNFLECHVNAVIVSPQLTPENVCCALAEHSQNCIETAPYSLTPNATVNIYSKI